MQAKPIKAVKKRAATPQYVSPNQLTLVGFDTPFDQKLYKGNRWVKMAQSIPWDSIVPYYDKLFSSTEGRPPISGRVILGSIFIKHLGDLSDRETVAQIQENMFMQYFLGYSSFTNEAPFSPTLFVEIRERLSLDLLSKINDVIAVLSIQKETIEVSKLQPPCGKRTGGPPDLAIKQDNQDDGPFSDMPGKPAAVSSPEVTKKTTDNTGSVPLKTNKGKLLMDATVAPQNITFPTDLKLLNAARIKSEQIIDSLYDPKLHGPVKARTYRQLARKAFLNTAKKKSKTNKEIYRSNSSQLRYLKRNLAHIETLLKAYKAFPLTAAQLKYLMVLHTVYDQQQLMHSRRIKRVDDRIVNIHQPHVRPIVRGKEKAKAEFGSKLQVAIVAGYTFIDHFSWDAFNEGSYLMASVEKYKTRFGFYPAQVLADQIYCTRENRKQLKLLDIQLMAKPLGRPSAQALKVHLSPGERNPIEGKFGQAKVAYGLEKIKAKLSTTSQSWIAAIAIVLNLVRLTRHALLRLIFLANEMICLKWNCLILASGARRGKNLSC